MAKYSVPQIKFTEIDNSVRTSATPGLGIGAIVFKSNKGPVNQRILTSSYDEFKSIYGEPEDLTDYGHFAAERYLGVSNQLWTVRATMGDEAYAQIQYPYSDAEAKFRYQSTDAASFKYVDNEDASQLDLCDPLKDVTDVDVLKEGNKWLEIEDQQGETFALQQKAKFCTINDLITDAATQVAIFKADAESVNPGAHEKDALTSVTVGSGQYVKFAQNVAKDGTITKMYDDLVFTQDAWDSTKIIPSANFVIPTTAYEYTDPDTSGTIKGYKVKYTVPASATLNNANVACTMWLNDAAVAAITGVGRGVTYQDLFANSAFYKGKLGNDAPGFCTNENALKLQFTDWDDCNTKTYYVAEDDVVGTVGQAVGIAYREYGMSEKSEALAINDTDGGFYGITCKTVKELANVTGEDEKKKNAELIQKIADDYGLEASEIVSEEYSILSYVDASLGRIGGEPAEEQEDADEKRTWKLIYTKQWDKPNEFLFWIYSKKDSRSTQIKSVYTAEAPEPVVIPWQEGMEQQKATLAANEKPLSVNKLIAYPTSEVLNNPAGTYKDGYTMTKESDEEPGNGDVEQYIPNMENQLVIAAIGPGKFGNDIGVSIITTECADIPALNHQNAFCWKYKYDDEDQVDRDDPNIDFTWKKVYRINVYAKTKTQTAEAAWGNGLDALLKDPIESWFVSNDPHAKDGEGNSLFAPNVINGKSEYIYVSRSSVNDAMTGAGEYAQPVQTFAIYGLTGGTNSKKNNMSEKTQALKLYADRQKADFDILFNVEAIDTFNGKQRYAAFQRRIAEIAAARTMDIGVVQVTSKESKTVKRMLSEGKAFAFQNGSYVAAYAGYDKYYNSTLASWIYLPKSVAGAIAMAYCDMYAYPWMAPAGVQRGTIDYTSGQMVQLSDDEIGQLYDVNINTSRPCGGYGEVLWGQKTALKKESALNRINVRRCMNYIEKQLENMMVPYMFAQNTPNTRAAAKNQIDSFLSRVKAAEGVLEYATSVTDDPNDEHILNVNIVVRPAEAIEFIDVKIIVTRSSVDMSESIAGRS
jgi:hypothetical protein